MPVLAGNIPGDPGSVVLDHWPRLVTLSRRRLGMMALAARAAPPSATVDEVRALLARIDERGADWRARFAADVETVAWASRARILPATLLDRPTLDRLRDLVARPDSAYPTAAATVDGDAFPVFLGPRDMPHFAASVRARHSGEVADAGAWSEADRRHAADVFRDILGAIRADWPEMAVYVARQIRLVFLVPDLKVLRVESNRRFPGVVTMTTKAVESLRAEDLVHEATHHALFCLEADGPFRIGSGGEMFVSAWSGRRLHRNVYIHLPVVYFVVARYLHRVGLARPSQAVAGRLREIAAGLEVFFADEVGRDWLTDRGRVLHDEVRERFFDEREAWQG